MNTVIFEAYQAQWNGYAVVLVFLMLQANYLRQQILQFLQFFPSVNIQFAVW